jgi:hypothetical protein
MPWRSEPTLGYLKRTPSKVQSSGIHRFLESPYGKNLNAGGRYAHESS